MYYDSLRRGLKTIFVMMYLDVSRIVKMNHVMTTIKQHIQYFHSMVSNTKSFNLM